MELIAAEWYQRIRKEYYSKNSWKQNDTQRFFPNQKTDENKTHTFIYFMFKPIFKLRIFFLFLKVVLHLKRWNSVPGPLPCCLMLLREHPFQPQKPVPAQITHLCEKNVIKQQLSFWLIFSDICIGIHPKDFRSWGQRQCLCVFDVAFVLQRWVTRNQEIINQEIRLEL